MNLNYSRPLSHTLLSAAIALTGCAVGPDYVRPAVSPPAQWSESHEKSVWEIAAPADVQDKGEWWNVFGDTQLDALQQQARLGNLTLQAAVARLDQAKALTQVADSALLPSVGIDAQHTRTRTSANRPNSGSDNTVNSTLRDDNIVALSASYEIDLFGRARRTIEASVADAQQAAADLENIKLLLAADVATTYFSLRAISSELAVLDESVTVQSNILDIVHGRYTSGAANGIDLAQQELIVANNRAQQQLLLRQYEQQRHLLATLLGVNIDTLQFNAAALPDSVPTIPLILPSELLQRRPDIAHAERAVAAANAQIGVARAAWFPTLSIGARDGFESSPFDQLFTIPSAIWSVGVAASQTLFDGGRTQARENYAFARHREATANYRNTVLSAWQEVEDNLTSTRTLAAAHRDAQTARTAAIKVADITDDRYEAGLASAVERYVARQNALTTQRQEVQLAAQQWINAVALIKALGGGWNADSIATASDLR